MVECPAEDTIMHYYFNDIYEFECPICGLQTEFSLDEYDPDNPVVTCPMCDSTWVVEETDHWLEAVQEIK
jgi:hypothetical protein